MDHDDSKNAPVYREKEETHQHHEVLVSDEKMAHGKVTEINAASVALATAVAASKPSLLSKSMLKLYAIMSVCYLLSTMQGYDGSLMGAVNAMKPYQHSFGLSGAGSSTGVVFIVYNIGQITAFPICPFLADGWGRRVCIFVGLVIVLIGTAVQTTANSLSVFMGGRYLLGLGSAIANAAAPAYTVELAHPAYRGTMAGLYNNFWFLGSIIAGWATYGANKNLTSSWAWRIPTLVQAGIPAIVLVIILFLPESPRWLILHDRQDEGLAIFAKYHGDGDVQSPIVQLEYREVIEDMALHTEKNSWWNYKELVNTRAARYRLGMVIGMAFFGQWSGNNVVSYFLPAMMIQAGITDPDKQLLINAIVPIFQLIAAMYGATLLDKLGRRFMMLSGLAGCLVSYIMLTAFTAESANNPDLSYGVIVSVFLFSIIFAWSFTPLQALYSVECLENRTRAKGSGLNFLFMNIAMIVNTYGISVGIEDIGWYLYIVYIGWIVVEMVIIYFFFVETTGKTLEEMGSIFEARNPRKESTRKMKVRVDEGGNVLDVGDA